MRVRAVVVTCLSAVVLTACGGGSSDDTSSAASSSAAASAEQKSGPELAAAAADALEQAGSVRITGSVPMDEGVSDIDLQLQGADVAGTMALGDQSVQLIITGGSMYMQASTDFWAAQGMPASMASSFAGTWVLAPADAVGGFSDFSLAGFVTELRTPTDGAYADEVTSGELDGQPVWLVTQAGGSVLKVAAKGTPYPLEGSLNGQTMTLSDFGKTQPIQAPAEYLDLSDLGS
jgi:hypothetical protein